MVVKGILDNKCFGDVDNITVTNNFTCLNGTNNGSGNIDNLYIMNFASHQLIMASIWLNAINITGGWKSKQVISIPKSHFKFSKAKLLSHAPTWVVDSQKVIDVGFDISTGIITVTSRQNVPIENASVEFSIIVYN